MKLLQKHIDEDELLELPVGSTEVNPGNMYLLLIHPESKKFNIFLSRNPRSYLLVMKNKCRSNKTITGLDVFSEFVKSTDYSEWRVYQVKGMSPVTDTLENNDYTWLGRLGKGKSKAAQEATAVLMKVTTKDSDLVRWCIRDSKRTDEEVIQFVLTSTKTFGQSFIGRKTMLAANPDFDTLKSEFLQAKEYTVQRYPDSELLKEQVLCKHGAITRRLNIEELKKLRKTS